MATEIRNNAASTTNHEPMENTYHETNNKNMGKQMERKMAQSQRNAHTKTLTPEQQTELKQHIYFLKGEKNRQKITKSIFHKHKEIPDKNELTAKQRHYIGQIFLQAHEIKNHENTENERQHHECPTCGKIPGNI